MTDHQPGAPSPSQTSTDEAMEAVAKGILDQRDEVRAVMILTLRRKPILTEQGKQEFGIGLTNFAQREVKQPVWLREVFHMIQRAARKAGVIAGPSEQEH